MEEGVKSFEEDRRIGLGEERMVEEGCGFGGIGCRGFLEKDVFPCFKRLDGPFEVEAVGEGDVDCVY